jgi:hypothetical protein
MGRLDDDVSRDVAESVARGYTKPEQIAAKRDELGERNSRLGRWYEETRKVRIFLSRGREVEVQRFEPSDVGDVCGIGVSGFGH